MKIRIPKQEFMSAVNKVKSVVSSRTALPILSHIYFETLDSAVRLAVTDLKVSIECIVDCTVEDPGTFTVSAQRLASILPELPDADVVMELGENNVVVIKCNKIETKLFSMSPDEFPPIRSFDTIEPLIMQQGVLKKLFSKTSFSLCLDQTRYTLTGLLFEIANGKLTVVSTDGRRMSLSLEDQGIPEGIEIKVIIPGKMVNELERLLSDEGEVRIYLDQTQAAFAFNQIRMVTALIEGNFPNYEMVIPKRHDKECLLVREDFVDAMRRTRTMTNDKFNSVRFIVEEGQIIFKVVTPEVGEYVEEMPAEYSGESVEVAFNPEFILDILRHTSSDKVWLILKDSGSPGLLKPFTEDGVDRYLNVVMPIRI